MAWTEKYLDLSLGGTGGAGSDVDPWKSWGDAVTGLGVIAAPTRVNVKGAAAHTTNNVTLSTAGAAATPVWWRGYNTTPGDLDTSHDLALPSSTWTTAFLTVSGAFQYFSNLSFEGATTTSSTGVIYVTAADCRFFRCRSTGTAADADCVPWRCPSGGQRSIIRNCWFTANAAAPVIQCAASNCLILGNVCRGGANGITATGTAPVIAFNVFDDNGGNGISTAGAGAIILGNSIYSPGSDGIVVTSATVATLIANNVIDSWGAAGYAVNSSAGASGVIYLYNNAYYDGTPGAGVLNNIVESVQFGAVTLASSPFVNAAGHDFRILADSAIRRAAFPGSFENESYAAYGDIGAVPLSQLLAGARKFTGF